MRCRSARLDCLLSSLGAGRPFPGEKKTKQKEKAPRKFRDSERECERKRGRSWHHAEELRARMQITLSTTLRESAVQAKREYAEKETRMLRGKATEREM